MAFEPFHEKKTASNCLKNLRFRLVEIGMCIHTVWLAPLVFAVQCRDISLL